MDHTRAVETNSGGLDSSVSRRGGKLIECGVYFEGRAKMLC